MGTPHPEKIVRIAVDAVLLEGALALPEHDQGVVVFAHGSGSSRFSPRNNFVARIMRQAGIGTLLMDFSAGRKMLSMKRALTLIC